MAAISVLNPRAEVARRDAALQINIQAAKAMAEVVKGNLGPKGTMKMLVSGCGDIKITKDGNVLLQEMKIQHPTASLIAKASTAHDDTIGDGTSSIVLFIGELMKLSENVIGDGCHPRHITDGINVAKEKALEILDSMKIPLSMDRCFLINVARSSLRTKVHPVLADHLAEICTDAVLHLYEEPKKTVDLHMIEIITMQRRNELETSLVKGIVMDHGGRHPNMPSSLTNCYILTCNVSLEYEKTEINTEFFYSNAAHHEKLLASEHDFIDQRVKKIIQLKKQVCLPGEDKSFLVVNQKGIDPLSLQALADEGILGLRRAKRRNMERLAMACGGMAMNSLDELTPDCLGYAGQVYEQILGDNKFTFVKECKNPKSVTILVRGPTKYGHVQITDALRDGLRALSNAIADDCVVHGAGAVELKISKDLELFALSARKNVGIKLFSNAILCIPKALIRNAGYNVMEMLDQAKVSEDGDFVRGLDLENGGVINPATVGIYDVYAAKKQIIDASTVVATNLLLTDEIMRAGLSSLKTMP